MSAAIAQGFTSSGNLVPGMLASLKSNQSTEVIPADTEHTESLVGVVVKGVDASINLNSGSATQVATSGTATVFVTDLAGEIKSGDKITASPLAGVGMKATDSTKIVGVAEADFDTSNGTKEATVTSKDGSSKKVLVGSISVQVQPSYYTVPQEKSAIPAFLQQFSYAIAGKQISTVRILSAVGVLLLSILVVVVMLMAAVRSSILSIGRNPLARGGVYRSLFLVFLASVAILSIGVGSTYLILRY